MMILDAPLVLQGKVTKVEVRLMTPKELFGGGRDDIQAAATEVTMKVEKIIAGNYDGDKIRIFLMQGKTKHVNSYSAGRAPMKVNVGDHAVVAVEPNSRGTGLNVLDQDWRFFRVEGTKLVPYREEFYLAVDRPFEVMARDAKARERQEMHEMQERLEIFKASDLVCMATVIRVIDPDSSSRRLVASIDETLKGKAEQSEITVDMSGILFPGELQDPGRRVMLFLERDGSGYKPATGINGYYVMDGERIKGAPFQMSVSQLKSAIMKWKKAGR